MTILKNQLDWFARKSQQLPLRLVLVIPFLLQIFGAVGLIGYWSLRNGQRSVDVLVRQLQTEIAQEIDLHLRQYLREPDLANRATIAAIELGLVNPTDHKALIEYLRRAVADNDQINTIQYGSLKGDYLGIGRWQNDELVLKRSAPSMQGRFEISQMDANGNPTDILQTRKNYVLAERDWFKKPSKVQVTSWSPVYVMFSNQMLGLTLAESVKNSEGKTIGVIGTDILLAQLNTFLRGLRIGKTGQAFILERSGALIGSSTLPNSLDFNNPQQPVRLQAETSGDRLIQATTHYLRTEFGDLHRIKSFQESRFELDGKRYFLQVNPYQDDFGLDWLVVQTIPETDFMAQINANTRNTIIISMIALGCATGVGLLTSRWIANPILQLSHAAIALAEGEWDVIIPENRKTTIGMLLETSKLAFAFNRMRLQLQKSFDELAEAKVGLEVKVEERTRELRQSELKYRGIFDNSQVGIFRTRISDGLLIDANARCVEMMGYERSEDVVHKLTAENFYADVETRDELLRQTQERGEVRNFETQFRQKNGSVIDVLVSGRYNEEAQCLEGVINDISDLKQAERLLQEKEEYLRLIINNIPQQVFWKDQDLRFRGCNPNWAIAAGLNSPEEVVGKTDFDLLDSEVLAAEFRDLDREIMRNDQGVVHRTIQKVKAKPSGETIWLDMSKVPIHDVNGNVIGILGVLEDITQRKLDEEALNHEREKSEALLLNILPKAIAEQLKENATTIAEQFPCATIMFADLVDFTSLASQLPPQALLDLLNQVFSEFDRLAEKHGLEKIKTIGDAYMVAGGLPIPREDHGLAIAEMALDMVEVVQKLDPLNIQLDEQTHIPHSIRIRIGINTGAVIAGVIGTKKFIYDLWGDAVNVASRMESSGEPSQIQVTSSTYELLKHDYLFEERGMISVKGKGEMTTYWLLGRKHDHIEHDHIDL